MVVKDAPSAGRCSPLAALPLCVLPSYSASYGRIMAGGDELAMKPAVTHRPRGLFTELPRKKNSANFACSYFSEVRPKGSLEGPLFFLSSSRISPLFAILVLQILRGPVVILISMSRALRAQAHPRTRRSHPLLRASSIVRSSLVLRIKFLSLELCRLVVPALLSGTNRSITLSTLRCPEPSEPSGETHRTYLSELKRR
jgi:hypothetical protein